MPYSGLKLISSSQSLQCFPWYCSLPLYLKFYLDVHTQWCFKHNTEMGHKDKEKAGTLSVTHLSNELYICYHFIYEWWYESLLFMTIQKHLAKKKKLQEVKIELSIKLIWFQDTIFSWWQLSCSVCTPLILGNFIFLGPAIFHDYQLHDYEVLQRQGN